MEDERYALPERPKPEPTEVRPHRATLALGIVAIAVSILAMMFSGVQAIEGVEARKAAELSASAAERSAAAAEHSLKAAIDEFHYVQRPIPSIVNWSVQRHKDGSVKFLMGVTNNGKSACLGIQRDIYITLDKRIIARTKPLDAMAQGIPMGPFTTMNYEAETTLPSIQWSAIDNGKSELAVHLIFTYHDALDAVPVKAGWCLYYDPNVPNKLLICSP